MTLRGKALPLLIVALLVAGPVLILAAVYAPVPGPLAAAMKRVPQHLMSRAPGTGAAAPEVESGPALTGVPLGTRASGTDPVIVIPIEFTDVGHSAGHNQAYFDSMMNSFTSPSVNEFYRENSYGTFQFNAVVAPWVQSTHTMSYYGQDGSGVDDASGPIYRLVAEAVRAADASVNFANFDRNSDGVVDHVVIVHAGGAQESSSNPNLIWSHRWAVIDGDSTTPGDQRLVADGKQIYGYVMISEDSPFGVLTHEFGHDLGLPDLYDTDTSTLGIGVWDVMGSGSWNGNPRGTSPSDFSAWSKIKLGWVTPIEVTTALLSQRIPAVENNSVVYRLTVKTSTGGDEYFLVENRDQIGFDASQPGSGLLIWHVDDSVPNNDNEAHRLLDLEEADEATGGDHPADPGDPWSSNQMGWGPDSNPNSNGYGNLRTGWKVRNIGAASVIMTADLSREVDDDLAVVSISHPYSVQVGGAVNVAVTLKNSGARTQTNVQANLRAFLNAFEPGSEVLVPGSVQPVATFPSGAFMNLTWSFTAASPGRYILDARVNLTGDEIPENNERLAHVNSRTFYFQDDVEGGNGSWMTPLQGLLDGYRWDIISDSGPYGKSHSPTHAWRFGYYGGIPNVLLTYHILQSQSIGVPSRNVFLLYYQSYDLSRTETPNATETDHAVVEVQAGGSGPWREVAGANFSGKNIGWKGVSLDLSPYLPAGPSTLSIRFKVTSSIMPNTGGWWLDDIMVAASNFSRAVAVLPVISDRSIEPGGEGVFTFKVANIGDFDDQFRFSTTLPSGWTAVLVTNSTSVTAVDRANLTLASDAESSLQFRVQSPTGVLRGAVEVIPLTVTSMGDTGQHADFIATARIADPLGLGGIQKYIVWIIVIGIALVVVVILVDHVKARKFRGHIR